MDTEQWMWVWHRSTVFLCGWDVSDCLIVCNSEGGQKWMKVWIKETEVMIQDINSTNTCNWNIDTEVHIMAKDDQGLNCC